MDRFFDRIFLNNTVLDYLLTLLIIVFAFLLKSILARYLAKGVYRLFQRRSKDGSQYKFIELILQPLSFFLLITFTIIALYRLDFPTAFQITIYRYRLQTIVHTIGIILQIISFTWLLLRVIDFIAALLERKANLTPDQTDNQLIIFFKDFLKVVICIIGMLMLLHMAFHYNVGSLLTGLSIVGAAIALALRESLENLIASFIIFFDKPFTSGDAVKVQQITGNVERIGLRSTRIRTGDKTYVTVPNKQMVDSILDNLSLRSQIRGELPLHLNLGTAPAKIESLIYEIKHYLSRVEEVQHYNVLFQDIRLQAFVIFIEFFTNPIEHNRFQEIRQQLNLFVLQTIEKQEIKLAEFRA